MTGFVYCWKNLINLNWYIGSHKGSPGDGYIGSGKVFNLAVKKYGIENFERTILYEGADYKNQEEEILFLLDAANDPRSYNLINNYFGGDCKGEFARFYGRKHSEETKQKLSIIVTEQMKDKNNREKISIANTGRKHSEETKQKYRETRKKENNSFYGKTHNKEAKEKISIANTGRKHSEESLKKMSNFQKGRQKSEEHRRKIGESNTGKIMSEEAKEKISIAKTGTKHSEETKKKISEKLKGRIPHNKGKQASEETKKKMSEANKGKSKKQKNIECPHCFKIGSANNMKRWHFNNCKLKK